ncbi:ABC transporter ATP-binding protein [Marixanthomonas ophiurae]|uniref:ABC transporter ATP-binding protein n=1 Tax=Marixanthomonas ophiurae TaxID=387659 RepID=A0A3E1QAQ7_9FLAO|nr:ABC transporter ATP-binding protein [Marixanthomonas ophiurae]RFN59229.1 ABC transporter ATP-binding protein [Marixanthomonas ophiurae]
MLSVSIQSFSYDSKTILQNINFELKRGNHLAVLGESGCGKSTLLHIVYGLLHVENGSVLWENEKLKGPSHTLIPGEPFMKLVAQDLNVMPFTTVRENIAEHLPRLNPNEESDRVNTLLKVVDLEAFANRKVKNLSGGQKQRVALAKALAKAPKLLLLDEPFSSIDTFRKNKLRRSLFRYLKEENISCITATHDAEEALAFSDELLLLKEGEMERFGKPETIYNSLETEYQAGFFGDVTVLPSQVNSSEKRILLPHQLIVSLKETNLKVQIKKSFFKGSHYLIEAVYKELPVFFNHFESIENGKTIPLKVKPHKI